MFFQVCSLRVNYTLEIIWDDEACDWLQEQGEAFLFIANYHALTSVHKGAALREMTGCGVGFWRVGLIRSGRLFIDRVMCRRCMSWRGCFQYDADGVIGAVPLV